jgi:hypothetical protein
LNNDGDRIRINHTLLGKLPNEFEQNRKFVFEKHSDCAFQRNELDSGGTYLWHEDHFDDIFQGDYSCYFDRINSSDVLVYGGISFSSLFFIFNYKKNILEYFVNTKPFKLEINDQSIELPESLIISRNEGMQEHYWINPLVKEKGFVFHSVNFKSGRVDEKLDFTGETINPIKVKMLSTKVETILPSGVELVVDKLNKITIGGKWSLISRIDPELSGSEIIII